MENHRSNACTGGPVGAEADMLFSQPAQRKRKAGFRFRRALWRVPPPPKSSRDIGRIGGILVLYRKEPHFKNSTHYIYTHTHIYFNILKAKLPNGRPLPFCFGRWCCSCNGSRCLSWHLTLLIQEDTGRSPPLVIEKSMVHNSEGLLTLKGKCMHKWVVGFRLT